MTTKADKANDAEMNEDIENLKIIESPKAKRPRKLPEKFLFSENERKQQEERDAKKKAAATKVIPPNVATSTFKTNGKATKGSKRSTTKRATSKGTAVEDPAEENEEEPSKEIVVYSKTVEVTIDSEEERPEESEGKSDSDEIEESGDETSETGTDEGKNIPDNKNEEEQEKSSQSASRTNSKRPSNEKSKAITEQVIRNMQKTIPDVEPARYNVAKVLSGILENQKVIFETLNDLKAMIANLSLTISPSTNTSAIPIITIPIETLDAQKTAEQTFTENKESRDALVSNLSLLGGTKPEESVRIILKKFLSTELRLSYNAQKAMNGKLAFRDTPCYGVVVDSVRIRHKDLTEDKILQFIGEVLVRSKDEKGGRALRKEVAEKKRQLTKQAEEAVAAEKLKKQSEINS